jgi:hypothetical protein
VSGGERLRRIRGGFVITAPAALDTRRDSMTRMAGLVLGVALAVVLGGCADGTADAAAGAAGTEVGARTASSASSPRDLLVRTRDHVFDAPARVASGATRIRLVNEGPDFHHVWLIRLEAGRTVEELERALAERPVTPDWAVDVGVRTPRVRRARRRAPSSSSSRGSTRWCA